MSHAYREKLIGSVQEVLFEEAEGEFFIGHAPNYVKVYVSGRELHNEVRPVRITEVWKDGVIGTLE